MAGYLGPILGVGADFSDSLGGEMILMGMARRRN